MYCILKKEISLRSFKYVPYAYYSKNRDTAIGLQENDFKLLLKCDGKTKLNHTKHIDQLIRRGLIEECSYGQELDEWQIYHKHDNRYMPRMNLQITGRCNYNCIHCFNAKDNAPLQSELSLSEIEHLLDECVACGIRSFTITGGEPMIHHNYKEVIEMIYQKGMFVFELNTNGFFIDQKMLDWMKAINYKPLIKISFDGLGFHNWMRGSGRAEEETLKAIKLCVDNGFEVKVQMNINKKNQAAILDSLKLLDEMGVKETRIIKTTNAPRWLQNGKSDSMSINEYYAFCTELLKAYLSEPHSMALTAWMLFHVDPRTKYYNFIPVTCREGEYRDSLPLCKGSRGMIAVGSDGKVFPCLQAQGYFVEHNIDLGNIKNEGLKQLLNGGPYLDMVATTVDKHLKEDSDCKSCGFFELCCGGCPALAILTSGNYLLEDRSRCIFFKEEYYKKLKEVIPSSYKDINRVDYDRYKGIK